MNRFALVSLLFLLSACGSDSAVEKAARQAIVDGNTIHWARGSAGSAGSTLDRAVVLGSDYTSSALDAFEPEPATLRRNLLTVSGDAVLKRIGTRLAVLNRGGDSNIILLDEALAPGLQVSLPKCGPHDIVLLPGDRALVTCYEAARLRIVNLLTGDVQDGPDLAPFADADGIPEADHMAVYERRVYVSLQKLDRTKMFAPTGNGLLVAIDADTLMILDADPTTPGVQAYDLGCTSPYTTIETGPDGKLYVGCSGAFDPTGVAALVTFAPSTGLAQMYADAAAMGGPPSALRLDSKGVPYVLVSYPDAMQVQEMRVVRLGESVEVVLRNPGFSLSGLAITGDDSVLVGNRVVGLPSGIWAIDAQRRVAGALKTSLAPFDIEMF